MTGEGEPPAVGGALVETAPVPVVVYDADYRLVYANDAAVAVAGADGPADLEGEPLRSFVASDDADAILDRMRRVIEERERAPPRELTLRSLDGDTIHAEAVAGPVTYEGEPAGQAVLHDVTELKRREQQLRRERDRLTALFDTVPEPATLVSLDTGQPVVRRVNDAFEETFGHDADELVGENLNEFIVPEEYDDEAAELDRRARNAEDVQTEVVRETADGRRPFLFRATGFEFGDRIESLGIYTDISEQKEREAALQRERDRFATLFENLPNPVVHGELVDDEPVIRRVNPAFEETFGHDAEDVVGESLDDVTVPDDRRAEARRINRTLDAEGRLRTEVVRETSDGPREFVLDAVMAGGTGPEGYAIYTDITDQKEREAALQRQNERLEEFAGIVSHDLRSPLSVARGNLSLYRDGADGDRLERVDEALTRMDRLLEELLTLARKGEDVGEPEPVDLRAAAREAWDGVRADDATLTATAAPVVDADPLRLSELLQNLFRNAVEHAGPAPTVEVGPLDGGFYVADDGPGIPEGDREAVFEPGHTTEEGGTGFGLAIVADIAAAHGWSVRATASDRGGARFEFTGVDHRDDADL